MVNEMIQVVSRRSRQLGWQRVKRPLAGIVLTLGLLASGFPTISLKHTDAIALPNADAAAEASFTEPSAALPSNGIYLYGESPEPNQIGHTYAVFEVSGGETVGAFYMPSSSFDCFYGEVGPRNLNLMVVNSYEQVAYPYSVPLRYSEIAANSGEAVPIPMGYHRIEDLSQQDHQMLDICRNDSQRPLLGNSDQQSI